MRHAVEGKVNILSGPFGRYLKRLKIRRDFLILVLVKIVKRRLRNRVRNADRSLILVVVIRLFHAFFECIVEIPAVV